MTLHDIDLEEIMSTKVLTVKKSDLLAHVAQIFEDENIHHLPVVTEEGAVIGILSSVELHQLQDAFTIFKLNSADQKNKAVFNSTLVEEVMKDKVVCLYPDQSVMEAYEYFKENLFHAIPVVDRQTKALVGIVSTYDLLAYAYNNTLASERIY